ncbi:MAG: hypothetical protein ACRCTQ_02280 [Brevinemataceae bacterium]
MLKSKDFQTHPILIIAGEVSGDMFAAELIKEIKKKKNYHFIGFGGPNMQKQGMEPLAKDNSLFSSIGLFEAVRFLWKHLSILNKIVPSIKKHNVKNIILVDHEFFNIIAAKKIRKAFKNSVNIYFFIPPRVSMWGARQAPVIADLCDALFCYMKPDLPIYKHYNNNSFFFGNPLNKKLRTFVPNPNFFELHNLNPQKEYIALMPGSRKQEIETLFPIFLQTAQRLNFEYGIEFLMTAAHPKLKNQISQTLQKLNMSHVVHIINNSSLEIMSHVSIGLVSAGTITLEAVFMNMFPIITYKVSDFTFNSIKKSENLSDRTLLGLPNVFLEERIFPEIIQFEVTPETLYKEINFIRHLKPELLEYVVQDAKNRLIDVMGETDSIEQVADYIVKTINGVI